ncbi:DBH-like monooxygenase protein 2 homolog, partial [Austrofundulus limnaeus]|uniref:DBH-like monooxygenase protein 2 homolog n=1 Tax=Austrofundulus limnaeus TaxID=52670 RepID=A0A2I4ALL7_AUSLI
MSARLFFLVVSLAWTKATWAMDMDYNLTHSVSLGTNVHLKWGFDLHRENITFELTIGTTGWVSLGFSPHGGMDNADIVMGGLGSTGSYFTDRFSTGESMPTTDELQNYHLISMTEHNGETIMTFHRLVDTKDPKDYHITDQSVYLIYAYGDTDEMK